MNHSFSVRAACEIGVKAAILLEDIVHWTWYNKADEERFHDGRYWVYHSVKAWHELYPYLSEKQIRSTLDELEQKGLVVSGNYNKLPFDRTKWYSITPEGLKLQDDAYLTSEKLGIDLPCGANEICPVGQTNTVTNNSNNNTLKSITPPLPKHKYGEYQHVLLTDDQYNRLVDEFGAEKAIEYIMKVDEYCQMHGKTYKDYNLTVRKFIRTDSSKGKGSSLTSSADSTPEWYERYV